jgi:hypothetical protein
MVKDQAGTWSRMFQRVQTLPKGSGLAPLIQGQRYERWITQSESHLSFTIRLTGWTLPPGTERHGFGICIDIKSADAGAIYVVVTCGSRGGPASAVQIEMPAAIVSDIFNQYTSTHSHPPTLQDLHARADAQIKACLNQYPRREMFSLA